MYFEYEHIISNRCKKLLYYRKNEQLDFHISLLELKGLNYQSLKFD